MTYQEFLKQKEKTHIKTGFEIDQSQLNPMLFDFQKYIVQIALKVGRFAIFGECGTGKTPMQLEWGNQVEIHETRPVLFLAPLAVVEQTIEQAAFFGYKLNRYFDGTPENGLWITNFDQFKNVDVSIFTGVILDECFAPDTKIQVVRQKSLHEINIKDCIIGDKVLNCTGLDTIKSVKFKKVSYAIKLRFNGKEIISSPRHPYFTQRGWVAAKEIRRGDAIASTDKAMRILRGEFSGSCEGAIKNEVLREILFSEMENETTAILSECSQSDGSCKKGEKCFRMAENAKGSNSGGTYSGIESNEQSRNEEKMFGIIEGNGTQTFSAWGKWSRNDIATAINEGCTVRQLESGICYITGEATPGLSHELQSRFSSLRQKDCNRSGWNVASQQKRTGQKEGYETGFFRVESFEVLESGHIELDRYRDETGTLYFVDLEIERHPSFTINEGLVHNSSILKNSDGKMSADLIGRCQSVPFRLACSATPSPNDHMELGQHSQFLGAMSYNEMLAMFFVHDGGETSKWRLRKHAEDSFWKFVCTWSISLDNPGTLGFDGSKYVLPEINYIEHFIKVGKTDGKLFADNAVSATDIHQDFKKTAKERLQLTADLVNNSNEQWIVWGLSNQECAEISKMIDGAINVQGSDKPEIKAKNLLGFAHNEFKCLVTKTSIASFGMNYQNAFNMVFLAYDFKFEGFYQAVRREYRFGQQHPVNVHLMIPESQLNVKAGIETKALEHKERISQMAKYSANTDYKVTGMKNATVSQSEIITSDYHLICGDCVQETKKLPDNAADIVLFSPPFAELYVYSDKKEDMGNVSNYQQFEEHFKFLIPELKRVLKPGRICAVHCMDLPIQKGKEGYIGLRDFSGMLTRWFQDEGFIYHARTTIWKNPVTEMQRTKALGLLHKQIKKDSTMSRVGIPDYILFFRNEGENETPITHQDTNPSNPDYLPVDLWQKYASPVWMDIDYGRTLNYRAARDNNDEKHICPLQQDTIERVLHLYSNEGDTVLSPFGGIGSEGVTALSMGRKSISIELKESYFLQNHSNHKNEIEKRKQVTLF